MTGWSFFRYLLHFITVLLKLPTWRLLDVIMSKFNLVWWLRQSTCVHHHVTKAYMCVPSRYYTISTTQIKTYVVVFLLMVMASFRPYVIPSLIRGLCQRTPCVFFFLFITIFLCLHVVSRPFSFCLHAVFTSFSSCLHIGLNLFLVWTRLNYISKNNIIKPIVSFCCWGYNKWMDGLLTENVIVLF